ncbi:hypothetical protein EG329_007788 [Mollisiaceae sp. DMI_Dod_QoI]|nr:hypothetical protein EG329_007788 [Helotiales sp. DMI_Dod_QoI]
MYATPLSLSFASLTVLAANVVLSSATVLTPRATPINGFIYTSCQSAYDFLSLSPPFFLVDNSTSRTIELCTSECAAEYAFATVYGSQCFCGQNFTAFASSSQDIECNTPCPGNAKEICGGFQNVARGSEWRSLYSKVSPDNFTTSSSTKASTASTSTLAGAYSTSTLYTTKTFTITSCSAAVTNCPARVTNAIIGLSTTVSAIVMTSKASSLSVAALTLASTYNSTTDVLKPTSTVATENSTVKSTGPITSTPSTVAFKGTAASVSIGISELLALLIGFLAFM